MSWHLGLALGFCPVSRNWVLVVCVALAALRSGATYALAESDPAHKADVTEKPLPWPDGIVPYDFSQVADPQQETVRQAMQLWMDTRARITFVPRTTQSAYVRFTGKTDAGNNASQTGFKPGVRTDINITAFWWRQGPWMPAHELGHALGFHHEHARWDRDDYIIVKYDNLKPERRPDYDWIPRAYWLVDSTPYDYYSIMHYRVCWSSSCEARCHDADGSSPCAVLDPIGTNFDRIIGQWTDNKISATDAEKARRAYGVGRTIYVDPHSSANANGTIEAPFRDVAQALNQLAEGVRVVLFPGEYELPTRISLPVVTILSNPTDAVPAPPPGPSH